MRVCTHAPDTGLLFGDTCTASSCCWHTVVFSSNNTPRGVDSKRMPTAPRPRYVQVAQQVDEQSLRLTYGIQQDATKRSVPTGGRGRGSRAIPLPCPQIHAVPGCAHQDTHRSANHCRMHHRRCRREGVTSGQRQAKRGSEGTENCKRKAPYPNKVHLSQARPDDERTQKYTI